MTDDRIDEAMNALIEAVAALGFERARDAIAAYGDEADPDAKDWHGPLIDAVAHAVRVAEMAGGGEPYARWLSMSPEPGQWITWEWEGDPGDDFADMVMRSVASVLARRMPDAAA